MKEEKQFRYCPFCGKRCYTEREANAAINEAKRGHSVYMAGRRTRRRHVNKQIPKRKYYCKNCGSYHLSHLPYYKENKDYE